MRGCSLREISPLCPAAKSTKCRFTLLPFSFTLLPPPSSPTRASRPDTHALRVRKKIGGVFFRVVIPLSRRPLVILQGRPPTNKARFFGKSTVRYNETTRNYELLYRRAELVIKVTEAENVRHAGRKVALSAIFTFQRISVYVHACV